VISTEYKKAWEGIYPLELELQRSEMLPQFANVASPGDMVVVTSFTLEIGDNIGTIHFCLPYATLEPIATCLYSPMQGEAPELDRRWVDMLKQQLQPAMVELVAELAQAPATVEQLLSFKPGDFIELDLKQVIQAKVSGRAAVRLPLRHLERPLLAQGRPAAHRPDHRLARRAAGRLNQIPRTPAKAKKGR
jgi:flagellar motor switch protein FliM